MDVRKSRTVVVVTNIPNHYRIPLFNTLNQQLAEEGVQLHVIFASEGYESRRNVIDLDQCHFSHTILRKKENARSPFKDGVFFYPGLLKEIRRINPQKIIVAGFTVATLKLYLRGLMVTSKIIIWSGTIDSPKNKIGKLKTWFRKLLVKRAVAFMAYGSLAREYFMRIGAEPSRVTAIGNTVDTAYFEEQTDRARSEAKPGDLKYLTYIGYLNPRKNLWPVVHVCEELTKLRSDIRLDIVGDGQSREELENYVREKSLDDHITFHGFKQKEELPHYLARSSCFLFQTEYDIWGLVLNEAMAAGVPCLASVNAGATEDLIEPGVTGFKADYHHIEETLRQIEWIIDHPAEVAEICRQARERINKDYSLQEVSRRIRKVLHAV